MPGKLVTIARFRSPAAAHFHRSRLELEGIPAFVGDEHLVSLGSFYSGPVGGVKLQVRDADVERALAVLREEPEGLEVDEDEMGPCCPRCGSLNVRREWPSCLATLALVLAVGIPFLRRHRGLTCMDCGHRWAAS